MKRLLLIQPPYERLMGYSRFYSHPGLLSLAAVVEEAGHDVLVYDADYDPGGVSYDAMARMENFYRFLDYLEDLSLPVWQEICQVIADYNPDYIGITIVSATLISAKIVAQLAKEINPQIKIIVGGVHPTICPDDCRDFSDYIVRHEGEEVIVNILEGKIKDQVITTPRIDDLDSLPLPSVHCLYGLERYEKRDLSLVISTRGCPNNCRFCNSPQIWKRRVKRKSVRTLLSEIKILKEQYGVNDFFISDDSFTYNQQWLEEFCREVKKLNITWRCLARVDQINERKLDLLTDAGCRNIKFGIESGSQRILDMVRKNIKVEDVLKSSEMLERKNINWSAFFMMGFVSETEEDIRMTQNLIKKISAKSITVSIYTPFPGDDLYKGTLLEYHLYSPHSPFNNFTGVISDERFRELVIETYQLTHTGYIEHLDSNREESAV